MEEVNAATDLNPDLTQVPVTAPVHQTPICLSKNCPTLPREPDIQTEAMPVNTWGYIGSGEILIDTLCCIFFL